MSSMCFACWSETMRVSITATGTTDRGEWLLERAYRASCFSGWPSWLPLACRVEEVAWPPRSFAQGRSAVIAPLMI